MRESQKTCLDVSRTVFGVKTMCGLMCPLIPSLPVKAGDFFVVRGDARAERGEIPLLTRNCDGNEMPGTGAVSAPGQTPLSRRDGKAGT